MAKASKQITPRAYPPDTRPTKPIVIDGVEHQIHVKPVLGESGPYDLYDTDEVFEILNAGLTNTERMCRYPTSWRWYRMWYQQGTGLYYKYKMAPFVHYPMPNSPDTRWYCTEADVYDYIGFIQNGEWENVKKWHEHDNWDADDSIWHPSIDDRNELEDGWVVGGMHTPTMDNQRALGATEEHIYDLCIRQFYGSEALPPGVVLGG